VWCVVFGVVVVVVVFYLCVWVWEVVVLNVVMVVLLLWMCGEFYVQLESASCWLVLWVGVFIGVVFFVSGMVFSVRIVFDVDFWVVVCEIVWGLFGFFFDLFYWYFGFGDFMSVVFIGLGVVMVGVVFVILLSLCCKSVVLVLDDE